MFKCDLELNKCNMLTVHVIQCRTVSQFTPTTYNMIILNNENNIKIFFPRNFCFESVFFKIIIYHVFFLKPSAFCKNKQVLEKNVFEAGN